MDIFLVNSIVNRSIDVVIMEKNKSIAYKFVEIEKFTELIESFSNLKIVFRDRVTYSYLRVVLIDLKFEFLILEEKYNIEEIEKKDSLYIVTFINILVKYSHFKSFDNRRNDIRLDGNNILFTGKLVGIPRVEAIKIVERLGGIVLRNFSAKTNILICGNFKGNKLSTKYRNTINELNKGKKILVLKENEFLKLSRDIRSDIF